MNLAYRSLELVLNVSMDIHLYNHLAQHGLAGGWLTDLRSWLDFYPLTNSHVGLPDSC